VVGKNCSHTVTTRRLAITRGETIALLNKHLLSSLMELNISITFLSLAIGFPYQLERWEIQYSSYRYMISVCVIYAASEHNKFGRDFHYQKVLQQLGSSVKLTASSHHNSYDCNKGNVYQGSRNVGLS